MSRVLLIDGDEIAWRGAAALAKAGAAPTAAQARAEAARRIERLLAALGAGRAAIALSDRENWRRDLAPSYKAARRARPRPPALAPLLDALRADQGAVAAPRLEADDLLGLWATGAWAPGALGAPAPASGRAPGEAGVLAALREERAGTLGSGAERIVVSSDKDLLTVPGLHGDGTGRLWSVDAAAAARAHMRLTLAGDASDGYPGCPGIGPKRADAALDAARSATALGYWEATQAAYAARGLPTERALLQARLARVLQAGDLDEAGAPVLWTPPGA